MALTLQFNIEGERQLSRRLRGIGDEVKDWKPAFREAGKELVQVFSNDVFASRGRAVGESWAPLAPATLAEKEAQGYPSQPLVRTGEMKNSFQAQPLSQSLTLWNATEYFKYHQSNQPRSKLPRRVMMKLGEEQREIVVKTFQKHYRKKMRSIS